MLLWLQDKLGYLLGLILFYFLSRVFSAVLTEIRKMYADYLTKKNQEQKQEQLEKDVQEGKPRDEETRKHEEDWINS